MTFMGFMDLWLSNEMAWNRSPVSFFLGYRGFRHSGKAFEMCKSCYKWV